jgi:hypothetical protein
VGDGVEAIAVEVAAEVQVAPDALRKIPTVMIGTVGQVVEDLQARRERWDMSYFVVAADKAEEFAPVVAALAGT